MPVTLLRLEGVVKRRSDGARQVDVLDAVDLEIAEAETVGILGPRRSGKTTLLRIAAGIELPDGGSACFDGAEIHASIDARARLWRRRGIALVDGDWRPPAGRQTIDEVAMPLLAAGASSADAQRTALQALDRMDLASLAGEPLQRLSIGERLMVGLARALVREPRLLLVDEPAVMRMPGEARSLYALLRSLPQQLGLALVIASEDAAAVAGLSRVLSIGDGRLVAARGSEAEVIRFPNVKRSRSGLS